MEALTSIIVMMIDFLFREHREFALDVSSLLLARTLNIDGILCCLLAVLLGHFIRK